MQQRLNVWPFQFERLLANMVRIKLFFESINKIYLHKLIFEEFHAYLLNSNNIVRVWVKSDTQEANNCRSNVNVWEYIQMTAYSDCYKVKHTFIISYTVCRAILHLKTIYCNNIWRSGQMVTGCWITEGLNIYNSK
jgi:hypothetical protein